MPELPEVETVVRALRRSVIRKKIKNARVFAGQLLEDKRLLKTIGRELKGDRFDAVLRRGKYLVFYLHSGRVLLAHMKLTGHFLLAAPGEQLAGQKHVRFEIEFADYSRLLFSDLRKFGRVWLVRGPELAEFFQKRKLARDALSRKTSTDYLAKEFRRNRTIKALLLDQTVIAGIGNIYADEILWEAKISPLAKGSDLAGAEIGRLLLAIRKTLYAGIRAGGASIRDYFHPDGSAGTFQEKRAVYQRTGKPCPRCKTPIRRMTVAQRGTHFCPRCQSTNPKTKR